MILAMATRWISADELVLGPASGFFYSIVSVRDGGAELTLAGRSDSLRDLLHWDVRPGSVRFFGDGIMRLGAVPVFDITVDGYGTKPTLNWYNRSQLAACVYETSWITQLVEAGRVPKA